MTEYVIEHDGKRYDLQEGLLRALKSTDHENGVVEDAIQIAKQTAEALSRVVEILVESGIINENDLDDILGWKARIIEETK